MEIENKGDSKLREWGTSLLSTIKSVCAEKAEQPLFDNVIAAFEGLIQDAQQNKKTKVLRQIVNEIEFWSLNLDPEDAEEVNRIMKSKFGKVVGEDNIFGKINLIIKRGMIKNLNEYRFVNEILNLYSADTAKKDIIKVLTQLAYRFEKNYKKKIN